MKQLLLDIQPASPPTLENFVAGRNSEVLHSLQQILAGDSAVHAVYLWGDSGSGKSHLLQACASRALALGLHLVCADDVHRLDEAAQIRLFDQYNQQRENGGLLIACGTAAPTHMALRDDLATRLAWGLVYQLQPLSDAEKALALKSHAQARGMRLPDEVVDYCLRHLRRDLPTLMATLDALDEWSLTEQKPVTVPLLRKLLQFPLNV